MYEDLRRKDAVDYWKNEGNNKRMQQYYKIQNGLRIIRWILAMILVIHILKLVSTSIITLCTELELPSNLIQLSNSTWIINTYKISIIVILLSLLFYKNKNYSIEKLGYIFLGSLLVIPLIVLMIFHFAVLGSLMSSFYLVVLFVVIILTISKVINRINVLYDAATKVVENKTKRKGEKYAR